MAKKRISRGDLKKLSLKLKVPTDVLGFVMRKKHGFRIGRK